MATDDPVLRPGTDADLHQILALASRSLGWAGDERDRAYFQWKHVENPAGASPSWVAEADGEVVAFRTILRWSLERGAGQVLPVGRAVDTATDPEHQGRGLFRRLTLRAVDDLTAEGMAAIFNTPNAQSRPGYLKMGWHQLGRPTLGLVPATLRRLPWSRRVRGAAEKWSQPCDVGQDAATALDDPGLGTLLASLPPRAGLATRRTAAHLRWRYRFEPLAYRVVEAGGGIVVFRVRRRGPAREVVIAEWLAPRPDPRAVHRLVREVGDYGIAVGLGPGHGVLPLPRQGPIVTWRTLADPAVPELRRLRLSLGDLELL